MLVMKFKQTACEMVTIQGEKIEPNSTGLNLQDSDGQVLKLGYSDIPG